MNFSHAWTQVPLTLHMFLCRSHALWPCLLQINLQNFSVARATKHSDFDCIVHLVV